MRDISAVVYEKCPVDILVGRNCPEFQSVLKEADDMHQINVVTTQQQASLHEHGEEHQELMDLIGAEYDFPQTNLSQQTETADQQENQTIQNLSKIRELIRHYSDSLIKLKILTLNLLLKMKCYRERPETIMETHILKLCFWKIDILQKSIK